MRPDGSSRQVLTPGRTLLAWGGWSDQYFCPTLQHHGPVVECVDHVAGVYNASARTLDIYVNGVLNNGTLSGTVPASQINSAVNVNIGRRSGGSGYYFNGVIDDVHIYNRALSQAGYFKPTWMRPWVAPGRAAEHGGAKCAGSAYSRQGIRCEPGPPELDDVNRQGGGGGVSRGAAVPQGARALCRWGRALGRASDDAGLAAGSGPVSGTGDESRTN